MSGARAETLHPVFDAINLGELENAARTALPADAFGYYAGGANDEITLRANERAFREIALRYRVLVGVSQRDASTTILGRRLPSPVLIAPMSFQRLAHAEGELATARAAAAAGMGMVLSTFSTIPVADVRAATTAPLWFQLYMYKDRGATQALVERIAAAGCEALVLTVDAPMLGRRERDVRNRFELSADIDIPNALPGARDRIPEGVLESGVALYLSRLIDPATTWRDLDWLASLTKIPLLIKGVIRGDDAVRAVEHGAAGVIVSNHGGRQLDTAPATITALPEVVDALAGRGEVLMDGGIRRGTDVLKALAYGAKGVLLGRPVLWGLALAGERGVAAVLAMLNAEIDTAMALSGCPTIADITRDLIMPGRGAQRAY